MQIAELSHEIACLDGVGPDIDIFSICVDTAIAYPCELPLLVEDFLEVQDGGVVPSERCADVGGRIVKDEFVDCNIKVEGRIDLCRDLFNFVLEAGPVSALCCDGLHIETALVDVVVIEQCFACVHFELFCARVRVGERGRVEPVLRHEEADLRDVVDELEDDIGIAGSEGEVLLAEPPLSFQGVGADDAGLAEEKQEERSGY